MSAPRRQGAGARPPRGRRGGHGTEGGSGKARDQDSPRQLQTTRRCSDRSMPARRPNRRVRCAWQKERHASAMSAVLSAGDASVFIKRQVRTSGPSPEGLVPAPARNRRPGCPVPGARGQARHVSSAASARRDGSASWTAGWLPTAAPVADEMGRGGAMRGGRCRRSCVGRPVPPSPPVLLEPCGRLRPVRHRSQLQDCEARLVSVVRGTGLLLQRRLAA